MKADRSVVRAWTRAESKAARRAAGPVMMLGLCGSVMALGQAYALAESLADALLHRGNATHAIMMFAFFAFIRAGLTYAQERAAAAAGIRARRSLRERVLGRITGEGPALLRRQHSAEIAAVLVDRIEALDSYFSRWVPASVLWIASPAIILIGVATRNIDAALVLAVCGFVVPVAQAVFGIGAGVASRNQFQALTRLQSRFLDRIRGIATIVLSGAAEREAEALAEAADELRRRTMRILRVAFLSSAAIDAAMVIAIVAIVISQGRTLLVLAETGTTDVEAVASALFALLLVPEFFAPLRSLALAYQDRAQAANAAEAMQDLGPEASIPEPAQPVRARAGLSVTLRDVAFSWDEKRGPTLEHIDVKIPAGQTLILTGPSGSGKSTLIEMLLGFIRPDHGQILFDTTDLATLQPRDIATASAWVGQRPMLFAATVRENILFARPDATDAELRAAVSAAALDRVIELLPQGLDTHLGEGGFGLSGGQAQRVAIARAFLKDAPLLLLDEPTAHLDPETEAEILVTLHTLAAGRTVILCGHSAATRGFGGQVLELSHGRMSELRAVA
ncbi:thiol reductant ABC exporter subunit CydD [Tanticharoenia sakaeratensis]|nr:thiol reductant ABC exporter subunit CydD [Tanticharoenia sakaeratensis]